MTAPVIRLGTLNIRNTADRWSERADLLVDQLVELAPDILGLQEVRRPARQARWVARQVNARTGVEGSERPEHEHARYSVFTVYKTGVRRWWEGLAVLSRLPALGHDWLDLGGGNRVAQRVRVRLPGGGPLDVYNVHLHHAPGREGDELRLAQVERLLSWMDRRPDVPQVLLGDFNATPESAAIRRVNGRFRSAYAIIHGAEPEMTAPTPLSRQFGKHAVTIDFIFVDEHIVVHDAHVGFDRPRPNDPRLLPSDHIGLIATISLASASAAKSTAIC